MWKDRKDCGGSTRIHSTQPSHRAGHAIGHSSNTFILKFVCVTIKLILLANTQSVFKKCVWFALLHIVFLCSRNIPSYGLSAFFLLMAFPFPPPTTFLMIRLDSSFYTECLRQLLTLNYECWKAIASIS